MNEFRLYLVCHQFEALVASQLPPDLFGTYLAAGLRRQTDAEDIFFEIDPTRLPAGAFDIDKARRDTVPHADGAPKRSKYVSVYRVIERIPLEAFGSLHLTTRDGQVLSLGQQPLPTTSGPVPRMYLELCPTSPLVVSLLPPAEYLAHMTDPANPISLPRMIWADMRVDRVGGDLAPDLPYPHREHIIDCLDEIASLNKKLKIVSRRPKLPAFFRTVAQGFFVGDASGLLFYPYPTREQFESDYHRWWRSASLG